MGVDWHGLAIELHQNYTNKILRELRHNPACTSMFSWRLLEPPEPR
jgi:hypothetical protein